MCKGGTLEVKHGRQLLESAFFERDVLKCRSYCRPYGVSQKCTAEECEERECNNNSRRTSAANSARGDRWRYGIHAHRVNRFSLMHFVWSTGGKHCSLVQMTPRHSQSNTSEMITTPEIADACIDALQRGNFVDAVPGKSLFSSRREENIALLAM